MKEKCPECKGTHIIKSGFQVTRQGKFQRFKCQSCGRTFYTTEVEK